MNTPKKLVGAAAFSVALAAGGAAGALLGTPLSSGAQEAATTTAAADDPGPGAPGPGGPAHFERRAEKLTAAAEAIGISEDDLRTALESGQTIAQVAEANGVAVDTVIDALVADAQDGLRERITAMVNGEMPPGGEMHRGGPGGPGRPGGPGGHRGGRMFAPDPAVVADALGMEEADVRAALQAGQTLAQIATDHGVDPQAVIDAMVASATEKIDAAVAAGDLDADRAEEMKANIAERVTKIVNEGGPRHHDEDPDDPGTP